MQGLELLNEVARIATLDLELRPMMQRVTDALARRCGWEFVALVSVAADGRTFVCEAVSTTQPTDIHAGYSRELGSGVVGHVAATGEAVFLDDVRTFANYVETMPGTLAEACVPVRHAGKLVAILNVESLRPGAFRDQQSLLTTVADQIAGAIANARLYDELKSVNALLDQRNRELSESNTHLARAVETLERLSATDALTGAANRRHFDDMLALEWRRAVRAGTPLSLILLDIDQFKSYNDTHGHQAGDDCLRRAARTLVSCVHRAGEFVARYGGEEFAVLLPGLEAGRARAFAEHLRESVRGSCDVTISLGVATSIPTRDSSPAALIRAADEALYAAKRAGRNCVVG